ncbi:hypothetical protein Q7P37_010178 [Cladosporium fusiforme]
MCVVVLSVTSSCKHEMATIDYCPLMQPKWKDIQKRCLAGENVKAPHACTDSLGWMVFKALSGAADKYHMVNYGGITPETLKAVDENDSDDEKEEKKGKGDKKKDKKDKKKGKDKDKEKDKKKDKDSKEGEEDKKDEEKKDEIVLAGSDQWWITSQGPMLPGNPFLRKNRFVGGNLKV